ncbi:MAG: tRNA uracil 4-sulfurtransferase ThiI [Mycoplasmoidaceae bacterium]
MNRNVILIKYGDLYLKGKNKNEFINSLITNIKKALFDYNIKIEKQFDHSRIIFENQKDALAIIEILKYIPGISFIIPCKILDRDLEKLKETILKEFADKAGSFKVEPKRKDKNYQIPSETFKRVIAKVILESNPKMQVDVHQPNYLLKIEITNKDFIYYWNRIKGVSGLPIGLNGKGLVLLSGGIDSPVASFLLQRKGMQLDYITFITPPHTSTASLKKVEDLVEVISLKKRVCQSKLYVINFTNILNELLHIDENYRIIIMRRIFIQIATRLANMKGYNFIATGDSLGQVASQTLESMHCISAVEKDILILRPLLTFSKDEIIQIAKTIKTYEISILPYEDSCSLFVPKKPITRPNLRKITEIESKLTYINELINKSIQGL